MTNSKSSADIPRLVEELHVPWARREARRKLVALGAVEALLECLRADNESVVWAAVESLGELRAQEAVAPLADLMARGVLVLDVCEALTQITGQDFGYRYYEPEVQRVQAIKRWQVWLVEQNLVATEEQLEPSE